MPSDGSAAPELLATAESISDSLSTGDVLFGDEISAVAVLGERLFVSTGDDDVVSLDKSGGDPILLGHLGNEFETDGGTAIYSWFNDSICLEDNLGIWRVTEDGQFNGLDPTAQCVGSVTGDATYLYWVSSSTDYQMHDQYRIPKQGGTPELLPELVRRSEVHSAEHPIFQTLFTPPCFAEDKAGVGVVRLGGGFPAGSLKVDAAEGTDEFVYYVLLLEGRVFGGSAEEPASRIVRLPRL